MNKILLAGKDSECFKRKDVILSGDGRCDSPGKTAKWTYFMMENKDNLILHTVMLDKCQAQLRSPNMERMTLVKRLQYIIDKGVKVKEVITDASTSVTSDLGM